MRLHCQVGPKGAAATELIVWSDFRRSDRQHVTGVSQGERWPVLRQQATGTRYLAPSGARSGFA